MEVALFEQSPAGQVVRIGQGSTTYPAFVPHPLPPALEFDLDLARVLSDADRALGELAGLGRALPNPHLLIHPFIRREAVLSSRIEGTQTDLAGLYAFEAGQKPPVGSGADEADAREVHNYVVALEYGLERLATLPVSLRLLRELHERLLPGVRGNESTPGEFRRSQTWIGPPGCALNDATYVPPPVQNGELQGALDAFERYLHAEDGYPPLVRLALIHYQFEAIHPFLDGNGRIGRLLIVLLLVSWDLLPHPLLYLSVYFERHQQDYYRLLLAVSARGAWREWLLFFLRGVADQARDAVNRAKRLQDLEYGWRAQLLQARAPASALRLTDSLFESPVLTIPEAQRLLHMSYPTAQSTVQKLVDQGILQPTSDTGYGRVFAAGEILKAIGGLDDGG